MENGTSPMSEESSVLTEAATRRTFLKGTAAASGALILPGFLASCGSDADTEAVSGEAATGEVTVGSNFSDETPKAALQAAVDSLPNADVTTDINTVDHNSYQENITTYLQAPDDVMSWFAGYRMRFFAEKDLVGDISDVWSDSLAAGLSEGFKSAATGDDGNQYFVPLYYYAWGVFYLPSLFEENGYTVPTKWDDFKALCQTMQDDGLIPLAFTNDGKWQAMGTFDQLNLRINGYQYHVDLMAGKHSWDSQEVKDVFAAWAEILPFHQDGANGRTWQEGAAALDNKEAGMFTLGAFLAASMSEAGAAEVDFFPFPEINAEHGQDAVEAPIDGFMMAKDPKNPAAAKELLAHLGSAEGQNAYLSVDPSVVAAASGADTSGYSALQKKQAEVVGNAKYIAQFLDRDTNPEFASNVMGDAIANFINDPGSIDSILADVEEKKLVIFAE